MNSIGLQFANNHPFFIAQSLHLNSRNDCALFVISDDGESSASVQAFDAILAGPFQTYLTLAKKIGDDVAKHGVMVEAAFKAQRDFLVVAAKSQKPSDAGIGRIT